MSPAEQQLIFTELVKWFKQQAKQQTGQSFFDHDEWLLWLFDYATNHKPEWMSLLSRSCPTAILSGCVLVIVEKPA